VTTGEWLASRKPRPPEQLAARLQPAESDSSLEELALGRLERLIAGGDHTRAVAGELLAVDALVTYACEAAVERWQSGELTRDALVQWCERFAMRIAGIAGAPS
jgi:hypothetical protein